METLRPPSPDNGFSAAQWCPEDVLREIMNYLSKGDVTSCSLVCRGWLNACRAQLYTIVRFGAGNATTSAVVREASLLARTFSTSPHLLGFIRHLSIFPRHGHDNKVYQWIPILASFGRVRDLRIWHWQSETVAPLRILSSMPPFPSIEHISLCRATMEQNGLSIRRVLEIFPNADSVVLELHRRMSNFSPPLCGHRVIRRISILAFEVPVDVFFPFLGTHAPTLTRLDIGTTFTAQDVDAKAPPEELLACILLSMTHLVSLTIIIPSSQSPFLDYVVPQLPRLRELCCVHDSCSSTLLQELPGQIHTLRLLSCLKEFEIAVIEEMIWRSRARQTSLRNLFMRQIGCDQDVERIKDACAASGICFDDHMHFNPMQP